VADISLTNLISLEDEEDIAEYCLEILDIEGLTSGEERIFGRDLLLLILDDFEPFEQNRSSWFRYLVFRSLLRNTKFQDKVANLTTISLEDSFDLAMVIVEDILPHRALSFFDHTWSVEEAQNPNTLLTTIDNWLEVVVDKWWEDYQFATPEDIFLSLLEQRETEEFDYRLESECCHYYNLLLLVRNTAPYMELLHQKFPFANTYNMAFSNKLKRVLIEAVEILLESGKNAYAMYHSIPTANLSVSIERQKRTKLVQ